VSEEQAHEKRFFALTIMPGHLIGTPAHEIRVYFTLTTPTTSGEIDE